MHIPSLVKIHWCLLKLSSGNEIWTDRQTYHWQMDGRTDWHTDVQCETIIPRHYRVAGYKKLSKNIKKKTKKKRYLLRFWPSMLSFCFNLPILIYSSPQNFKIFFLFSSEKKVLTIYFKLYHLVRVWRKCQDLHSVKNNKTSFISYLLI